MPDLTPVSSSNIQAVGYDPATATLYVRFRSGAIYCYEEISAEQHRDFINAPSIGQYFQQNIRVNVKGVRL